MILNRIQREAATKIFGEAPFAHVQAELLNATVRFNLGDYWGSGVIFFATTTDAYVLTAKHVLLTLLNKTEAEVGTPEKARESLLNPNLRPTLFYGPSKLLEVPKLTAPVVDVDFKADQDNQDSATTWTYDACVLRLRDDAFRQHALKFALINSSRSLDDHVAGLKASGTGMRFLDTKTYQLAQLGYGDSSDKNIGFTENTINYVSYSQKVQFKTSTTEAAAFHREVFSIEDEGTKFPTNKNVFLLNAISNEATLEVTSTGTGDSGGPFLAVSKDFVRLVGVTMGANYFVDPEVKKNPQNWPDSSIWNNAATAVTSEFLEAWAPIILTGYDLELRSGWGQGIPTTGRSLVILGLVKKIELHIRVFDGNGNQVGTDVDGSNVPAPKKEAFETLERRIQTLATEGGWTYKVKAEVINAATSIARPQDDRG